MPESNLQLCIERARQQYSAAPLMEQLCQIHGISQREFATIFGISKGHAEAIVKERVLPSLELGVRIARYWECTVEELFGWRIDDGGERRPLLILDRQTGEARRLNAAGKMVKAMELVKASCGDTG